MRQMAQRNIFSLRLPHLGFRPKFNFWLQRPRQLLFLKNFTGKGQLCMGSLFRLNLNKLCWTKHRTSWLQRRVLLQCSVWMDRCVSCNWNDQPQQTAASLQCGGKYYYWQRPLSWDRLSLLHSPNFFIIVIIINKYHPHQLDHHHYELDFGK